MLEFFLFLLYVVSLHLFSEIKIFNKLKVKCKFIYIRHVFFEQYIGKIQPAYQLFMKQILKKLEKKRKIA